MELMNRESAMPQSMDPQGRKWIVKGERGSALVHARPDPDRSDAQIPKEFEGKWTSPTVLKEKIEIWLGRQWAHAEKLQRRAQLAAAQKQGIPEAPQEEAVQKTAEESLAELPDEIREALGDIIALEESEDGNEEAEDGRDAQADNDKESTGRIEDTGSQEKEEEKVVTKKKAKKKVAKK